VLEGVVTSDASRFAAQLQLGQHYLRINEPKKAAGAFEAYFRTPHPSAPEVDEQAHYKLGTAYLYLHDWPKAQTEFESLLKTKPNELQYKMGLGAVYTGSLNCSPAIALYERMLGEATKQPSIYYNLGTCYLKERRATDAQREAELYVRAKSADPKGHILLCEARYELKNYTPALTECQTAKSADQASSKVRALIGKIYVAQKNYAGARAELEQALQSAAIAGQPKDPEVLSALVEVYLGTAAGKDKLLTAANELAAMTKDAKAQAGAGLAFFGAGSDERATQAYQTALAVDPNSGQAKGGLVKVLNHRAGVLLDRNDGAKALSLLEDAQKLAPDDLMTLRNIGVVLLVEKRFSDAELPLQKALRKVPNDMLVNRLLARALLGQSKVGGAMAAYERAAQIALRTRGPDLAGVYAEQGPLFVDADKLDTAVTVLETAVKEAGGTPVAPIAARNLAIAYFKRGIVRLRDPKDAEGALDDITRAVTAPKGALTAKEVAAFTCGEAFAALKANKIQQAEDAFSRVGSAGCALKPPYDKLGVQFFAAYAGYRDAQSPGKRETAAKTFSSLVSKVPPATADWIRQLLRSTYELLAFDYYQRSDEKRAEGFLRTAQKVPAKGAHRDLDNNLAALDLVNGRTVPAERVFEALGGSPPEALVNLGIVKDRQGDPRRALELYKRAQDKGARAPKLKEWIDVKERLLGARP
jgi:tetratricopeptide (TPR) repeat protein